jgi:hypothetical protein
MYPGEERDADEEREGDQLIPAKGGTQAFSLQRFEGLGFGSLRIRNTKRLGPRFRGDERRVS